MSTAKVAPSPERADEPLELCGVQLGSKTHICAFFHNRHEEYEALVPFMAQGLRAGERAFFSVEPNQEGELAERLRAADVDVAAVARSGHLAVRTWDETHLMNARFDASATLSYYGGVSREGKQRGFRRTRFMTQMGWACQALPGTERMLEYEAQANEIWNDPNVRVDPVICSYDVSRFSAEVIVGAMQTHPVLLIGGILQHNPFYVRPEQFLRELRARRGAA